MSMTDYEETGCDVTRERLESFVPEGASTCFYLPEGQTCWNPEGGLIYGPAFVTIFHYIDGSWGVITA